MQSKRDTSYTDKLDRVLIVYHLEKETSTALGPKFSSALLARLSELLAREGVVSEAVRPDEELVDRGKPLRAAATRFQARQVLHLGLVGVLYRSDVFWISLNAEPYFTQDTALTFGFSLDDLPRDQTVWRGEVRYYVLPDPKTVADQIVEQLAAERFLSGRKPGTAGGGSK